MRVGVDVGLLHHVLGLVIVAENGARRSIELLVVTAHQHLEEHRLTREDSRHDFFVRQEAGGPRYGGLYCMHRMLLAHTEFHVGKR